MMARHESPYDCELHGPCRDCDLTRVRIVASSWVASVDQWLRVQGAHATARICSEWERPEGEQRQRSEALLPSAYAWQAHAWDHTASMAIMRDARQALRSTVAMAERRKAS